MEQEEKAYRDELPLYNALLKARTAGNKNNGADRAGFIRPILDTIVGKKCGWNASQCERCFKCLLEHYAVPDSLNLLLATSGFDDKYIRFTNATQRRTQYGADNEENGKAVEPKTLERRENTALSNMAKDIQADLNNDRNALIGVIANALSYFELLDLGIEEIAKPQNDENAQSETTFHKYKRVGKLSNIGKSDNLFVGRASVLESLEDNFKHGCKIQLLGGADGQGKTRLALEYAQRHENEYQIICWINAWNEDYVTASIINFFDAANIFYNDMDHVDLSEVFKMFFDANTDWLIVFDNAELIYSVQQEMIKKYMPFGSGHILITGNFGEKVWIENSKFHYIDNFIDSGDENDDLLFMQRAIGLEEVGGSAQDLKKVCSGEPLALTLASSHICHSEWIDCSIYLHLMKDRGICLGSNAPQPVSEVAFDIKMNEIYTRKKFFSDSICEAVEQVLILSTIWNMYNLDLDFLTNGFPVFPEPLSTICQNDSARCELLEKLKGFGFYELRENVLQYNNGLNTISIKYFNSTEILYVCSDALDRMERAISSICKSQYIGDPQKIVALAKPYIDDICSFMVLHGGISSMELKDKYPMTFENSYWSSWHVVGSLPK